MEEIRIAIFDEDIVARRAISDVLHKESGLTVVVASGDTAKAIAILREKEWDVLLYEISSSDGVEFSAFVKLRTLFPELPIILLAKRDEEGAEAVVAALKLGAVDVITKPSSCNGLLFAGRHLAKRVVPIIRNAACSKRPPQMEGVDIYYPNHYQCTIPSELPGVKEKYADRPVGVLVIGGGSGAPAALFPIISSLPEQLSVPVVVCQHFPRGYTKVLARQLNEHAAIEVREAFDRAELVPGIVWIAPGGRQAEIHQAGLNHTVLRIHKGPRELGHRPSINILFRSAAAIYGADTLGVVLSGYGRDGLEGAEAIADSWGQLLVENPETAVAADLPLAVLRAGIADQYYNCNEMAEQMCKRIGSGKYDARRSYKFMRSKFDSSTVTKEGNYLSF